MQYEIVKTSDDESLFAWNDSTLQWGGMFAQSPAVFDNSGDIVSVSLAACYRLPWSVTNRGLAIDLDVRRKFSRPFGREVADGTSILELLPLQCARSKAQTSPICIRLWRQSRIYLYRFGLGEVVLGERFLAARDNPHLYERRTVYIPQVCIARNPHAPVTNVSPEIQSFNLS